MKLRHCFYLILLLMVFTNCTSEKDEIIHFRVKTPSSANYELLYEVGNWLHPDYSKPFVSLGNQRIVVEVENRSMGAVQVYIPWRRTDKDPDAKAICIVDAVNGEHVKAKSLLEVNQDYGHLAFGLLEDASHYYIYYLPHHSTGSYYPTLHYFAPGEEPGAVLPLDLARKEIEKLPIAKIISAQSIDAFHSFFPMEVKATDEEVAVYARTYPASYYIFPEYRDHPIVMDHLLPLRWVLGPPADGLLDTVSKGGYYTFQIGVWSKDTDLKNIQIEYTDLLSDDDVIPSSNITCFNLEGVDMNGNTFKKSMDIERGKIQSLWFGIDIPDEITKGEYLAKLLVHPEEAPVDTMFIKLLIRDESDPLKIKDDPSDMNRLQWLNSSIGYDKDFILKPFRAIEVENEKIHILGRTIMVNEHGLPGAIDSYFSQEMTSLNDQGESILAGPVSVRAEHDSGEIMQWSPQDFSILQESTAKVSWTAISTAGPLQMEVDALLEYDGMLDYKISLTADKDFSLEDFSLIIPLKEEAAQYMLGLGYKGGERPTGIDWKWDVKNNHHEGAWLGTVNKGLQYVLRDDNYERPLNTNFYRQKPLQAPPSWYNDGKGGIRIIEEKGIVKIQNYSGPRVLASGDTLHFNIRFLITPFKLIDTRAHFNTRFVHKYVPVDSVVAWKGTIVNVHHANEINPYINYPFYNIDKQKEYIDEAHAKGVKVKLYNTIRELSYKAYELHALRSLGTEILNDGRGGGHSWLQEHLRGHYHSAWHATSVNDAAILNKGNSRWTNYYVEGINWLAENQLIDGLYLDDIAFSRNTVKRLANVLQEHRSEVIIDLHSANQFNARDGFINSAFLYMEHMPYITRLWFGEYFEYDLGPDYWMTEVSGIPFGLTGEMLEGGGHPWRGLVYGMTSRIYGKVSPEPIWKLFDDYQIADSEMLGYWVDRSPIKTNVENIRSTVYIHPDHVMIAIGSWSDRDERVDLQINWKALGMDPDQVRLFSPEIRGLQDLDDFDPFESIPVEKSQGRVLVLRIK